MARYTAACVLLLVGFLVPATLVATWGADSDKPAAALVNPKPAERFTGEIIVIVREGVDDEKQEVQCSARTLTYVNGVLMSVEKPK